MQRFTPTNARHGHTLFRHTGIATLTLLLALPGFAAPGFAQDTMPDGMDMTSHPSTGAQVATAPDQIEIDNFSFSPATLTVTAGTKVTWTNHDDIPHTVVSGDDPRLFKSPPLDTDDAYSFVFAKPGTYQYFCSIHPKMIGTIIVKAP
jgi:plastocyanin